MKYLHVRARPGVIHEGEPPSAAELPQVGPHQHTHSEILTLSLLHQWKFLVVMVILLLFQMGLFVTSGQTNVRDFLMTH